ncbi:MAG: M15 family metallopeptidase [Bacteroidota bacterium]|nr:M15 family metallopeptidase [Bacteroidota bacterium]
MKCSKFSIITAILLLSTFLLACKGDKTEDKSDEKQESQGMALADGQPVDQRTIVGYTINQEALNQLLTSIMMGMNEVSLSTVNETAQARWENVKALCDRCSPTDFEEAFKDGLKGEFAANEQVNKYLVEIGLSPNLFAYSEQVDFAQVLNDAIDHLGRNRNRSTYTFRKFLKKDESRRDAVIQYVNSDFIWDAASMFEPQYEEVPAEDESLIVDSMMTDDSISEVANMVTIDLSAITTTFTLDELLGQVNYHTHENFVLLDRKYTDGRNHYLCKDAAQAFTLMADDAASSDINLKVLSSSRNFSDQRRIWENKWQREDFIEFDSGPQRCRAILEYSSMPGTSRHHWGTEVDIHSLNNSAFEKGEGLRIYEWLTQHAADYGFFQPYTAGRNRGYEEEKWHWSYYPVSGPMLEQYNAQVSYSNINGFIGSGFASSVGAIENYVNGIASQPTP